MHGSLTRRLDGMKREFVLCENKKTGRRLVAFRFFCLIKNDELVKSRRMAMEKGP